MKTHEIKQNKAINTSILCWMQIWFAKIMLLAKNRTIKSCVSYWYMCYIFNLIIIKCLLIFCLHKNKMNTHLEHRKMCFASPLWEWHAKILRSMHATLVSHNCKLTQFISATFEISYGFNVGCIQTYCCYLCFLGVHLLLKLWELFHLLYHFGWLKQR